MNLIIVILILFFIIVLMWHLFASKEGFWSINLDSTKQVADITDESYTKIEVTPNAVGSYPGGVSSFANVCTSKIPSTGSYDTMVITQDDSKGTYSCYVTNMGDKSVVSDSADSSDSVSIPIAAPPVAAPPVAALSPPVESSRSNEIKKLDDPTLRVGDRVMDTNDATDTTVYKITEVINKLSDPFNAYNQYSLKNVITEATVDLDSKCPNSDSKLCMSMQYNKYYDTNPIDGTSSRLPSSSGNLGGWDPEGILFRVTTDGNQIKPIPVVAPPSISSQVERTLPPGVKSLTDPNLKIDDLVSDGSDKIYKITNIVDKANNIVRAYSTYKNDSSYVANGSSSLFSLTISEAADSSTIYDTNPDDKKTVRNLTSSENDNGSFNTSGWNPKGFFIWVEEAQ